MIDLRLESEFFGEMTQDGGFFAPNERTKSGNERLEKVGYWKR